MNIHIMVDNKNASVWSSINEDGDPLFEDQAEIEILHWLKANSIMPLEHAATYFPRRGEGDYKSSANESEYLLTDKETALFLLRFK